MHALCIQRHLYIDRTGYVVTLHEDQWHTSMTKHSEKDTEGHGVGLYDEKEEQS